MDQRLDREQWLQEAQRRVVPRIMLASRGEEDEEEFTSWRTSRPEQAALQQALRRPPPPKWGRGKVAPEPIVFSEDRGFEDDAMGKAVRTCFSQHAQCCSESVHSESSRLLLCLPQKVPNNVRAEASLPDSPGKGEPLSPSVVPAGGPPPEDFVVSWFKVWTGSRATPRSAWAGPTDSCHPSPQATHFHHFWSVFLTDPSDFHHFSIGITQYFLFLRQSVFVFFVLSILSAPVMAAMISGNYYRDNGLRFFSPNGNFPSWETATLGGFGPAYNITCARPSLAHRSLRIHCRASPARARPCALAPAAAQPHGSAPTF